MRLLQASLRILASPLIRFPAVRPQLIPAPTPASRTIRKSAPAIPFLGSLFSSRAQAEPMALPLDNRSEDEWRAVLSPGEILPPRASNKSISAFEFGIPIFTNKILTKGRTIPHPPPKGHRTAWHRRVRLTPPDKRRLQLRWLQCPALQGLS